MKKCMAVTAFTCVIVLAGSGLLMAGALDRQNVQTRTNSVTQSMIRVPGVVGMEQFAAMGTIQQAGLAVSILPAKKIPKSMKGAQGLEGRVVDQTPASGGLAMYGTTVTIYVNKPKEADPNAGASSGSSWGTNSSSSWGSSPSSSSYNSQSAFPSSSGQAVQGQYVPQQGATGMPQQGSSQFQVQQYYYPNAQGGAPQDPQAGAQPVQPSADPNAAPQGVPPQDPSQPPAQSVQPPAQQAQPTAPPAQ